MTTSVLRYGTAPAGKEHARVAQVMDNYIHAIQTGSSAELKLIYMPQASYYFFREEKLVGGSIEILFDVVEGNQQKQPIVYSIPAIQVTGRVASVTLDIIDLGGVHVYDMFTLVRDDAGDWKITSKVAWRPDR